MCGTCGCSSPVKGNQEHSHEPGHNHHSHEHGHEHGHETETRRISVELDLLARNNHLAEHNREHFKVQGLYAINMVSSPGAGKTTLLEAAIKGLSAHADVYVIEGDQQTSLDADRITAAGAKAKQINTGAMCHLDAHMVGHAASELTAESDLAPEGSGWLFIENVGNLVCPAAFDLGESKRLVLLSVTEGDDKPLKYPDMFASSDVVVISKTDLLPYVPFDMEKCRKAIRTVNPKAKIFELSSTSGAGMDEWLTWMAAERETYNAAPVIKSVA
jgi:hydrogenase nickel incorporation protein HypB